MNRPLNWFVVALSVSVLGANLLLVRPHADSFSPPPEAEPVMQPMPTRDAPPAPSPFAYIHEDGSEEYLPSGIAEESPAGAALQRAPAYDSRAAVYSWSSVGETPPVSLAAIADAIRQSLAP